MRVSHDKPKQLKQNIGQLIGEILWYKRVIYTNGIEWRYFRIDDYNDTLINTIITTVNDRIISEKIKLKKNSTGGKDLKVLILILLMSV